MSLDQPTDFVKHQTWTDDAFLGGRLTVSQPRHGFRAGLDSVLLGAAVPGGTMHLLDLGSGVGAAALVALALGRAEAAELAERDGEAIVLARRNIDVNGFAGRARVSAVDITVPADRKAVGILDNGAQVVIANPPYFSAGQGTLAQEASRAAARHMEADLLDLWLRAAASSATAGGMAIVVYPAEGLGSLLKAFDRRFGALTILPLTPRPGAAATRVLVRGIKGSRQPLTLLGSRFLHEAEGNGFAPQFDAIFRGKAPLDW